MVSSRLSKVSCIQGELKSELPVCNSKCRFPVFCKTKCLFNSNELEVSVTKTEVSIAKIISAGNKFCKPIEMGAFSMLSSNQDHFPGTIFCTKRKRS